MKKIACIGSRNLTRDVLRALFNIGRNLVLAGHLVVSGNARGADQAFGLGANSVDRRRLQLWLPWPDYERRAIRPDNTVAVVRSGRHFEVASQHHPNWEELSNGSRRLMARNVAIIESADLVIGCPSLGKPWGGGTGFGMNLARTMGTPVVDLARGDGLHLLFDAVKHLPWPMSQDILLEITWLQRFGGRLDRPEYRERMQAIGGVLLAQLAEKSAGELADVTRQIPASVLWKLLDGRDLRQVPVRDDEDCIVWRSVFGGIPEDPIRHRVFLAALRHGVKDVEEDDPLAPEKELREIFQRHDTGNPMFDRERGMAQLHDGQRRWAETCVAMPSGIVLQAVEPERRRPAVRYLRQLAWSLFGADLGQPGVPASRGAALSQRWMPMIGESDFQLLRSLHEVFDRLELPEDARVTAVRQIVDEASSSCDVEVEPEMARSLLADKGRQVLRRWIELLAAAVEAPTAVEKGEEIDWDVFRHLLADRYPDTHPSFIAYSLDLARTTWARWQASAAEEVDLEEVESDPKEAGRHESSAYRENSYVVVGHIHRAVVPWDQRRSSAPKPTAGDRARGLFTKLVDEGESPFNLASEVEELAGEYRKVLDGALRRSMRKAVRSRNRRTAYRLAKIRECTSTNRLIGWREVIGDVPHRALLEKAIDERVATLRTLRAGTLTKSLKERIRWQARVALAEGGGFSERSARRQLRKELGKVREEELLDGLVTEAMRAFHTSYLTQSVAAAIGGRRVATEANRPVTVGLN